MYGHITKTGENLGLFLLQLTKLQLIEYEKYKLNQSRQNPTLSNGENGDNALNEKSSGQIPALTSGDYGESMSGNSLPSISQTKRPTSPGPSDVVVMKSFVTMSWRSLFLNVFIRTHSVLKIFAFKSNEISRKARAIIFAMKYHLGLFALSAATYYKLNLMPSLLQAIVIYIAVLPLSWPIELLLRYKANTRIGSDKLANIPARIVGEIQARIYEKLKFQNALRASARYIGYAITMFSFGAMSYFYAMIPETIADGIVSQIICQVGYILTIHEILQTAVQIGFIWFGGTRSQTGLQRRSTINKLAQFFVLKEVLESFQ